MGKKNDGPKIITVLHIDLEYRIDHEGTTAAEVESYIADIKSRIRLTSPYEMNVTRTFPNE